MNIPDPPAHIAGDPVPPGAAAPDTTGRELVTRIADARQKGRMPLGYAQHSATEHSFDPRLAYELALDIESPTTIFDRYGYDPSEAMRLLKVPAFIATVKDYKVQVQETGITFKLKARVQAEDLLTHSYEIATDPDMPPAVRADLIKWTAQMAELGPKKDAGGVGGGTALTLAITFAGAAAETRLQIVNPEREAIEGELS